MPNPIKPQMLKGAEDRGSKKPRVPEGTSRLLEKMVEAAGVEPASENRFLADLHA